jgi:hypothetical protein
MNREAAAFRALIFALLANLVLPLGMADALTERALALAGRVR